MSERKRVTIKSWWLWLSGFMLLSVCSYQASKLQSPAPKATSVQAQPSRPPAVASATKPKVAPAAPAKDIMKPLRDAKALIASITPEQCTPELAEICLSLLNGLGETLQTFTTQPLTPEQQKEVKEFRGSLVKTQKATLPALRKSYGKILADKLWEYDVKVKVSGASSRKIELVAGAFAANRNIKQMHQSLRPLLVKLRFSEASYLWMQDRGTIFTLSEGYTDSSVIFWDEQANITEVKQQ